MNVLAIIPARSGSKSIPDKNIMSVNGKPLIAYSIEQALSSKLITRTIVSTDSDYYAQIAKTFGAEIPFVRPAEISGDFATDLEVFEHAFDAELARRKVLGPAGTTVVLTILREGEDAPFDVSIVRAQIVIASAEGEMLEGNIAYLQVTTFGPNTMPELSAALQELMPQNPKAIILDLRNNSGGYLQTSVEVTSQFIAEGVVLYEQYGEGTRTTYEVVPGGMATDSDIPMIVLINEGSASASEIVAGALQDSGRAKLLGTVSYGKGSVQNWIHLSNENGAVRITIVFGAATAAVRDVAVDGKWIVQDGRHPLAEATARDFTRLNP